MRDVLRGTVVVHISHGGAGRHGEVLRAVAGDLQLLRRDVLGHGLVEWEQGGASADPSGVGNLMTDTPPIPVISG